jgi:putative transposase
MPQVKYKPEEIIGKLREAELMINQGTNVEEVCRKIAVSKLTYYRWRKEYGGLRVDQAKRMKELEQENGRLKKLVANLSLDNQILKEAASGNF